MWREAIAGGLDSAKPGDAVRVVAPDATPLGHGLADPASPIAVRMWSRGDVPLDGALWTARARSACELRRRLFAGGETEAYRVVHGEGDRMPGFVVDRYATVAVLKV
ncbi:MAG: class I SAM-dependent rRNA methyltransferase, partial [Polyangiaceae bacterium]